MQTILITGGTGLIGKALTKWLIEKGYKVIILTRSLTHKQNTELLSYAAWDIRTNTIDINALKSADHIIHLAGAGAVDKKWTKAYKKEIVESRTKSSKLIVDSLRLHSNKVKTIVSASGIGWYGGDKQQEKEFVETDEPAGDFLANTCVLWEESITEAEELGIRVCKLRTGIVLSNEGGALVEFKKPVRFGLAAILGSGKQVISWIHIDDICRMYLYAIENTLLRGTYNAVSPTHVTNKQLTLMLARILRGNFYVALHVPIFMLKIILGKRSIEVLKSTKVSCAKIKAAGFTFFYPSIESSMKKLFGKSL